MSFLAVLCCQEGFDPWALSPCCPAATLALPLHHCAESKDGLLSGLDGVQALLDSVMTDMAGVPHEHLALIRSFAVFSMHHVQAVWH